MFIIMICQNDVNGTFLKTDKNKIITNKRETDRQREEMAQGSVYLPNVASQQSPTFLCKGEDEGLGIEGFYFYGFHFC